MQKVPMKRLQFWPKLYSRLKIRQFSSQHDFRVIIYDRRAFIRLATGVRAMHESHPQQFLFLVKAFIYCQIKPRQDNQKAINQASTSLEMRHQKIRSKGYLCLTAWLACAFACSQRVLLSHGALQQKEINNHTGPVSNLLSPRKYTFFVSAVSVLFLKLIYYGAGTVVHLLLLKFSKPQLSKAPRQIQTWALVQ